jgi:hypothetical protein
MARGRKPASGRLIERLDGSARAKSRLAVVLEVLMGQQTVAEGAFALAVSERRFHGLRNQLLQAALSSLEPRPAGRPSQQPVDAGGQVAALHAQVRDLRLDLRAAQIREEIALAMPHLLVRTRRSKRRPRRKVRRKPHAKSGASSGCGHWGRPRCPIPNEDAGRQAKGGRVRWNVTSERRLSLLYAGRPASVWL